MGGPIIWCEKNSNSKNSKNKLSETQKGENNPACAKEVREKLSNTVKEKIKNNTWHLSFSHSRTHEYKGIKLHGKRELEYAKGLDANNIKWRRPGEKFPYIFNGKKSFYTPDFYLEGEKTYIEIKGYPTLKDFAKWDSFPLSLKIVSGKDLKEMGILETYRSKNIKYKTCSWE
jgi:hypothetical protein